MTFLLTSIYALPVLLLPQHTLVVLPTTQGLIKHVLFHLKFTSMNGAKADSVVSHRQGETRH